MKKLIFTTGFAFALFIACNKVQTQKEGGQSQDVRNYEESNSGVGSTTESGKNGAETIGEKPIKSEDDFSSSTSGSTAGSVGGSSYGSTSGMTGGGTTAATTGFTTSQTVSTTGTTGGSVTSGTQKTSDKVGLGLDNPDYDSSKSTSGAANPKAKSRYDKKVIPAETKPVKNIPN